MRRKPAQNNGGGGNFGRQQKQRFQGGGGGNNGQYNRPRKNYGQLREKYLAQARDALAAGDRVLAENYYQHADHCYRMLMEDQANRPQRPQPQRNEQQGENQEQATEENAQQGSAEEDLSPPHASALPAFLTGAYAASNTQAEPVPVQDWEERDNG